jgi:hypothetical protein
MSLKVTNQPMTAGGSNQSGIHHVSSNQMMHSSFDDMTIGGYPNQSKRLKCAGDGDIYGSFGKDSNY